MSRSVATLLVLTVTLAACGESRLNPSNWFGRSREAPAERAAEPQNTNALIPRERRGFFNSRHAREEANAYRGRPVDTISNIVIERVPGGAIIRATGVSRFQNVYDVRLTSVSDDDTPVDGVLQFRLEAVIPDKPIRGGSERVRTLSAGRALTDQQLEGVTTVRVAGVQNAQISSRR